ncbi:UDP-N-acetylmuramoyl-L-alanyl-D-glutamate--2,6-diaminopimelate ligase [Orientia tsutsugamushi]|uniref:UDP-N-acetylmuramoyl-L-alanyl-D-glutamate--2, 6-diaminopimelate ligase n=1 Tax=Orientia tsutsugamushi TaxID=784 RepID=A0A2U3QN72_ORITS|nr:UDP-N-acetylmuramoyl-L-alanyl-D-glutamate--2,6-diaminopimelate ligase [Orientia tsutsugamushi]KJV54833.1 UDP-N-acetylmuramyl-tripeptide synthetase family protein [Orientia tsutsugamushi str. Karp]KJV74513.1 UDP-N-acetylmuramyl-tripeptide synthetase family protein [Orientia tsutsugamushi str. TA763]SPP24511.1 UDP-N-acetylmuramoyl-L-alanyl-D-glutamate--2, 6-diaminopimelate ligase [Orientia tsutsugamushi]SPR02404.1 UDP-N-acetylmuramoyl-L-alanyl-D-glutamate--2, 6-diaminopimelate ligase [Orientia
MESNNIIEIIKKLNIRNIAITAQSAKPNQIFFALPGISRHGNDFIDIALANGASLIITDQEPITSYSNVIVVKNIILVMKDVVNYLYPKFPKYLVAVTGTDGKTSVVNYFQQLCMLAGEQAASIGTLGVITTNNHLNKLLNQNKTKPECATTMSYIQTRYVLHQLATNGINFVALEASSHGLDQDRLMDIKFQAAAFTSFSRDHLDYHKTMNKYLDAKLKLFKENIVSNGIAIVNNNINELSIIQSKITDEFGLKLLSVEQQGDIQIIDVQSSLNGQKVHFRYKNSDYKFEVPVIGRVHITNILIALLLAVNVGFDSVKLIPLLSNLKPIKGRMEKIQFGNCYAFVDYALTPNALATMLTELRTLNNKGRLITIFGGSENRDAIARRVQMGIVASKLSDLVIVTDQDSGNEDPAAIRKEILQVAPSAIEIPNRGEAIKYAISIMVDNDILLIAGKGHETRQVLKGRIINYNDMEQVKLHLKQLNKMSNQ